MHHSVVSAKAHRDRENQRRKHNTQKRQAHALVIACGLNPAFTPSPYSDGSRRIRRAKSQPVRRAARIIRNLINISGS